MPKITLPPDGIPPIPPAGEHGVGLKGSFILYKWRGNTYARSWPKKRTAKQRAAMQDQIDQFKAYVYGCKVTEASFQVAAAEMSKGTTLYPRDVQIMTMASTAYGPIAVNEIIGADDPSTPPNENPNEPKPTTFRLFPMSQVLNVSSWLDALGYKPGNVLVRQQDFWYSLEAGNPNDVLTIHPDTAMPAWLPGGGGLALSAGVAWEHVGDNPTTSTAAYATKGAAFTMTETIDVSALHVPVLQTTAATIAATIVELDISSPTTYLAVASVQSAPKAIAASLMQRTLYLPFSTVQRLTAGKTYLLAASIVSGTDTTPMPMLLHNTGGSMQAIPGTYVGLVGFDKKTPASGNTTTNITNQNRAYSFGIEWRPSA
jgi:hypothetical protein